MLVGQEAALPKEEFFIHLGSYSVPDEGPRDGGAGKGKHSRQRDCGLFVENIFDYDYRDGLLNNRRYVGYQDRQKGTSKRQRSLHQKTKSSRKHHSSSKFGIT